MEPKTAFADALGERRRTTGAGNQPLDVLILHEELTAVPAFEIAVRARVDQLAAFQHRAYARIRGVGRPAKAPARLAIASDPVTGVRLSEVLALAERRLIPLEIAAAFCLLRQIVPAVAALHEEAPDAAHGAIGPERIVITPDARVVVAEHVLGSALEQLRFSHDRYWKELRIPLPPAGGLPRFDRRGDVTQIGAMALALVLGRPLGDDEFPSRIADIVDGVRAISTHGLETLPAAVRSWLSRALQIDPRRPFATAIEAQVELDAIPQNDARGREALEAFLAQCQAPDAPPAPAVAPPVEPGRARVEEVRVLPPTPVIVSVMAEHPHAEPRRAGDAPEPEPVADEPIVPPQRPSLVARRGAWVAAAVVLIALASAGALASRRYFNEPAGGTLEVNTNPAGVDVVIDGERRGAAPLSLELPAGPHTIEMTTVEGVRTIPVTITEGAHVSQFIELPKAGPSDGQLRVRTDPPGATVIVDGEHRGASPLTIAGLSPGVHTVVLENSLASVTESVTVQAGAIASLVVPLSAPEGVPVSGWIAVAAPVEVQVFERGQLLGSSRSERLMVSAGRHDLEIVNDALGYRVTRAVQVTAGRVSPVRVELPRGSISFNAVPWADVWLDGERLGETPIGNVTAVIGTHDVVFRHPELGEQRRTVTVTLAAPARVTADLRTR